MKKTDLPQPKKLFKLLHEDAAMSVMATGFSAGMAFHDVPTAAKWPGKHVGAVVHLDSSGTWARNVSSRQVWVTQGHIAPEYINFYEQEGTA